MTDVAITEFEEIDPDELHLVGKGANGFKALLAKSASEEVRAVLEQVAENLDMEIVKADDDDGGDDGKDCPTCKGSGKIREGHVKCPKCLGTGNAPKVGQTEKELIESAKATAASGVPTPTAKDCPTCNGSGTLLDGKTCPDCNGTGSDGQMPPADKLNAQSGFAGSSDDGNGRTTIDKALAAYEELVKAKYKQKDRDQMASSGQAMSDGAYPVADAEDLDNAIHAVGRGGADHDAIRKHIIARAKALNLSSKIPDNWNSDGSLATKSVELVEKDGVVSGDNPFLGGSVTGAPPAAPAADDAAAMPGSPEWEAADAVIASDAANLILQAYELTRQFRDREAIEVAAGEGNDMFDTFSAECVLDILSAAIGQMATLAFHEAVASQAEKALDDTAEKSGARLSGDSISALVAARAVISGLLGVDDPESDSDDDDDGDDDSDSDSDDDDDDDDDETTKAILAKEIDDMTGDELLQVLDGRDEKLVKLIGEALKGKPAMDEADAISNAKGADKKNKQKAPKDENDDLEDEADHGDNESASGTNQATGAAKAADEEELTPEQIEAKAARKAAKKELRKAEEAEKQAAENAALTKQIEEHLAKVVEQNQSLQATVETLKSELDGVKKMAAPGGPVKTRTPEMTMKTASRDMTELRIAALEREARDTPDLTVRDGNRELIKELRAQLAS